MLAAVSRAVDQIGVEELDDPEPRAGEVKVRLVATGVCRTDLSILQGHLGAPRPIVLGHEGAGMVVQAGPGVQALAPGDPVVCSIVIGCGRCFQCVRGDRGLCERIPLLSGRMLDGTTRLSRGRGAEPIYSLSCQGSFAQYAIVPEACAVAVPRDAPLELLAGLACGASTGLGAALVRARVEPGASALVIGAGGVGLATMLGARARGAARIVAVDVLEHKRRRALELGLATHALDPAAGPLAPAVRALCGGRGADYAFDAVGAPGTLESAIEATRPGGTVVVIGHMQQHVELRLDTTHLLSQKTVTGTFGGSIVPQRHIPEFVEMHLQGRIDLGCLVDARYPLEQVGRALADLQTGAVTRGLIVF